MARVKNFAAGGSLFPADMDSIQDDYEQAFSTYRLIPASRRVGVLQGPSTSGSAYLLRDAPDFVAFKLSPVSTNNARSFAFYLSAGELAAARRTTQARLRATTFTNAVAPAQSYTFGLRPVLTWGGNSGEAPYVATAGTAVASAVVSTPGASAQATIQTTDFSFPADGWYVFTVTPSGTLAAGSLPLHVAELHYRQI